MTVENYISVGVNGEKRLARVAVDLDEVGSIGRSLFGRVHSLGKGPPLPNLIEMPFELPWMPIDRN